MKKRAENPTSEKAKALELRDLAGTWRQVLLPMLTGIVTTKKAMREWVVDFGMASMVALMEGDAERVVGCRKGGQLKGRRLSHWGYADTPFPYDGRQVVLPRPRVRTLDRRKEVELPVVKQLQGLDPADQRAVEQILLGVSTRGYEQSLGPAPAGLRTRGAKKSRVSELFIDETTRRMKEHFSEKLDHLDLVAMMLDGLVVGGHSVVVALGIAREGTKCRDAGKSAAFRA
jgi:hypothetical protein